MSEGQWIKVNGNFHISFVRIYLWGAMKGSLHNATTFRRNMMNGFIFKPLHLSFQACIFVNFSNRNGHYAELGGSKHVLPARH